MLVIVVVVVFAFWRPLFAGATLAPVDQLWSVEPFVSETVGTVLSEAAPPDAAAIHAAWVDRASAWRSGEFGFWDHDVAGGAPIFRTGVPFTHLLYVVVPGWFAPGLVAAMAMAVAISGARNLAQRRGLSEVPALFAGVAFGCSGLLFVWFGWPHATAFALVPWLWSLAIAAARVQRPDRSAAALAVVTAALLWCGVFSIAVLALLGAAAMVASDRDTDLRSPSLALGVTMGVALAVPHLAASFAHSQWIDAGSRSIPDSSADWATVLAVPFGSVFGNEAEAIPWLTSGSQQTSVAFAGTIVVSLAVIGVARVRSRGSSTSVVGIAVVIATGLALAYIGGPFETLLRAVAGDASVATHARVLVTLPLALAAADGLALLVEDHRPQRQFDVALRRAGPVGAAVVMIGLGAAWRWNDVVGEANMRRLTTAESMSSVVVLLVGIGIVAAWRRGVVDGRFVGIAACGLAAFELLSFGMAIPTAAEQDERLAGTAVHELVSDLAGPDGRVVGFGEVMAPSVSPALGIDDVRAHAPRSPGLLALFEAADADSLRLGVGGAVDAPRPQSPASVESGVWTAMGVDVLVAPAASTPPGEFLDAPPPLRRSDAVLQPVTGEVEIPEGGLRAVVLDFSTTAPVSVEVEVGVADDVRRNRLAVAPSDAKRLVVPIAGEDLQVGPADIVVRVDGEPSVALIGLHEGATIRAGGIAGDGSIDLIAVQPVLVLHRPTPIARFASQFVVETDLTRAAALVDAWDGLSPSAVLDAMPAAIGAEASALVKAHRSNDRVTAEVAATGTGMVVFDVPAAPGWRAEVDGHSAELVTADVAFGAVWVSGGEHVVELRYRPPHLWWSSLVALLGLGLLVACVGRSKRVEG